MDHVFPHPTLPSFPRVLLVAATSRPTASGSRAESGPWSHAWRWTCGRGLQHVLVQGLGRVHTQCVKWEGKQLRSFVLVCVYVCVHASVQRVFLRARALVCNVCVCAHV
jgi:hypothetical protein